MWWRVSLEMRCRWGRIPSRGGVMVESKIFRMSRSISSAYSPRCYLKRACLKSVLLIVGGILFATPVGGFGSDRSNSSAAASGFDGPAELPRAYVKSSLSDTPSLGRTRVVKSGGDLQAAIEQAACGDTIQLEAAVTFAGKFVFPYKKCDDSHWITIRTSAPDSALPTEGTRLTPCYAGVASLPGRPDFHCALVKKVLAKLQFDGRGRVGPIVFTPGANHFRFIGLEISRAAELTVNALISLEPKGTADHLLFDRMWIHGLAQEETTRGIQLGGSQYVAVVDSFFTDFHCISKSGSCTDSQAISGGSGSNPMGPYKIVNNFLEAAGENILFGGGPGTVSPTDIEVRRNHMFRPMSWKLGEADFVGGKDGNAFIVKNVFELKNAQRVLLEGNILENIWGGFTQNGFAVLLTPKNQVPNVCPLCRVTDVTIRYNCIQHMASGFQIANVLSDTGGASTDGGRYSIHDNILEDIDGKAYKGFGNFALISSQTPQLHDVSLDHNTAFPPNALLNVGARASGPKIANFVFTNNLVASGQRGIISTGGRDNCAFQPERQGPEGVLASCFSNTTFTHNAIVDGSGFPKGNIALKDLLSVGFSAVRGDKVMDYHLRPDSRSRRAGSDGKDLGADVDAVERATAGVL